MKTFRKLCIQLYCVLVHFFRRYTTCSVTQKHSPDTTRVTRRNRWIHNSLAAAEGRTWAHAKDFGSAIDRPHKSIFSDIFYLKFRYSSHSDFD